MLKKILFASCFLTLAAPASGAFAQPYGYGYGSHARDHEEHGAIHDEADEAHGEAHADGFRSRSEHRGYHRALRGVHDEFHDDHPQTRHDGYRLPSRRGGGYYSSYGYPSYQGTPYGYGNYGPTVTYSYGRRW